LWGDIDGKGAFLPMIFQRIYRQFGQFVGQFGQFWQLAMLGCAWRALWRRYSAMLRLLGGLGVFIGVYIGMAGAGLAQIDPPSPAILPEQERSLPPPYGDDPTTIPTDNLGNVPTDREDAVAPIYLPQPAALLRALDKVTAKVSTLRIERGQRVVFGRLALTMYQCLKTPPEETPEAAILLAIEALPAGPTRQEGAGRSNMPGNLFYGWMFASSPALNALEHPVYDVWLVGCLGDVQGDIQGEGEGEREGDE
jgi:hypothetical protein